MGDLYIGLMSGTSVDALDIALCRFSPSLEIIATAEQPFPQDLRQRINQACSDRPMLLDDLLGLEQDYTSFCADATVEFIQLHKQASSARAIGFHGQTLRHRPDFGATLQMANPSLLAERTGIDVIADFRRRDLAAGGEGAPLVPAFHQHLVSKLDRPVAILNLGGIANLSLFANSGSVSGFDTGPANTLMDLWISQHLSKGYDADGQWASTGKVNQPLLDSLLTEPYFQRAAPKSTGRELFNLGWLNSHLEQHPDLSPVDVQRTLLELTAISVTQSLSQEVKQLIVCGGGARNRSLMQRIAQCVPQTQVELSDDLGWPASHLEAVAFAWLAQQHLARQPGNLAEVTGAKGARVLGAHYPA
jgi:anhydro-N-acetylmuramic acid kinase